MANPSSLRPQYYVRRKRKANIARIPWRGRNKTQTLAGPEMLPVKINDMAELLRSKFGIFVNLKTWNARQHSNTYI